MASSEASLNPDVNFKRFLYICDEKLHFVSGDPIFHKHLKADNAISLPLILSGDNPKKLLNIIETVNSENALPHRYTLFFALAAASITIDEKLRHEVANVVLNITKDVEDLFDFLKFSLDIKGKRQLGTSSRKMFSTYYKGKEPMEFAKMVTKNFGYHGFKHKDIFKLVHLKSDNFVWGLVVVYIMYGLKEAQKKAAENSEATELIQYLSQVELLKRCENETSAAELIRENQFHINQVPTLLHKSKIVWEAIIPQLSLEEILNYLPKFNRLGFLKQVCSFTNLISDRLLNAEAVTQSKVHPVEVYIAIRNLEKGGRKIDPQYLNFLEKKEQAKLDADPTYVKQDFSVVHVPKCPQIMSTVFKTLELSYQNVEKTGKRYLICVQPYSDLMDKPCLTTANVTCLEAAALLTVCYLKAEQQVTVGAFSGNDIKLLNVGDKTFRTVIQKLKQTKGETVLPAKPMDWAVKNKKQIDVFVNVFPCAHLVCASHAAAGSKKREICHEALANYRKKMSLPNAKLINLTLSYCGLLLGMNHEGILDVSGFDANTPLVMRAFATNLFT